METVVKKSDHTTVHTTLVTRTTEKLCYPCDDDEKSYPRCYLGPVAMPELLEKFGTNKFYAHPNAKSLCVTHRPLLKEAYTPTQALTHMLTHAQVFTHRVRPSHPHGPSRARRLSHPPTRAYKSVMLPMPQMQAWMSSPILLQHASHDELLASSVHTYGTTSISTV